MLSWGCAAPISTSLEPFVPVSLQTLDPTTMLSNVICASYSSYSFNAVSNKHTCFYYFNISKFLQDSGIQMTIMVSKTQTGDHEMSCPAPQNKFSMGVSKMYLFMYVYYVFLFFQTQTQFSIIFILFYHQIWCKYLFLKQLEKVCWPK